MGAPAIEDVVEATGAMKRKQKHISQQDVKHDPKMLAAVYAPAPKVQKHNEPKVNPNQSNRAKGIVNQPRGNNN